MGDLLNFYWDLPPVTRAYLTGATALTVACSMDVVSPFQLYFNARQVARGELWRLVTNFLFFGPLGVDFLFHMFFVIRYCRSLEEGSFSQRSADFAWCLLFGMAALLALSPWFNMMFFASSLTFMLVYLWAKRNPQMQISLLGLLAFNAPYLPWVLLAFSGLLGHDILSDALGITVGHAYYYLEDVWPALADARRWTRLTRPLGTPIILHWIFRTPAHARNRGRGGGGDAAARLAEFELPAAPVAAAAAEPEAVPEVAQPAAEVDAAAAPTADGGGEGAAAVVATDEEVESSGLRYRGPAGRSQEHDGTPEGEQQERDGEDGKEE